MHKIHIKAQNNWINDPNGFIYYKGKYHMFYQCFPYGPRWGRMHWGHAVSEDLVNWEDLGIALFPSKWDDRNGCFSGSAIEHNGKMYLFYTGVRYLEEDPEDVNLCLDEQFVSAQMRMISEDGLHFNNIQNKKTVIPVIKDTLDGDPRHTRDPKVWREEDAWYMILGSTEDDKQGKVLFYRSEDLENWTYVNAASMDKEFGWMWECPDYFEVNGSKVLQFSPMGIMKDGKREENQAVSMLVEFDRKNCSMKLPEEYQMFDYGLDLYAPQSTVDEAGRRVVIAWARMPKTVDESWNGMFCVPRVVEVKNNHIYYRVHPNIQKTYQKKIQEVSEAIENRYRLVFEMNDGDVVDIGGYRIHRKGKRICTDRSSLYKEFPDFRTEFQTPELQEGYHVEVYVDPHLIEVFVNNGECVITNTVYGLEKQIQKDAKMQVEIYTTL